MKRLSGIFAAVLILGSSLFNMACAAKHHKTHAPATSAQAASSVTVWVNTSSGVYHYEGERWYGKTKHGQFMKESEAVKAGYRRTENGQ
jgi:hypothetical protein